jgi:hypothetical protein
MTGYYSDDPDVDHLVAAMVRHFGPNPWSRVPHEDKMIESIIRACRYMLDDCEQCAASIHITVH